MNIACADPAASNQEVRQLLEQFDFRKESILLIAHALEARDQNRAWAIRMKSSGRLKTEVVLGSEAEYLKDAERILDSEIVRMAEERIMERIRKDHEIY